MSKDISTFLLGCIAVDEAVAKYALIGCPVPWLALETGDGYALYFSPEGKGPEAVFSVCGPDPWNESRADPNSVEHMARFDPARILSEVAAKRAVMAVHAPEVHERAPLYGPAPEEKYLGHGEVTWCTGCPQYWDREWYVAIENCPTLRALAAPYSSHPDYDPEWAVAA